MEYEKPKAEFIELEKSDVIATSAIHLPMIPLGQNFGADDTEYGITE